MWLASSWYTVDDTAIFCRKLASIVALSLRLSAYGSPLDLKYFSVAKYGVGNQLTLTPPDPPRIASECIHIYAHIRRT